MASIPWMQMKQPATQDDLNQMSQDAMLNSLGWSPYSQTPEGQATIAQYEQQQQNAIQNQQQGVQAAQNELSNYLNQEKKIDLSPIAGVIDTWTGSNLARSYQRPDKIDPRLISALQGEVLKAQGNLTEAQTQALRNRMIAGQNEANTLAQLLQSKYRIDNRPEKPENTAKIARDQKNDELNVIKDITKSDEAKTIQGNTTFVKALNTYRDLVDKYGLQPVDSKEKNLLKSAYSNVKIQYKEAARLGALSGPDIGLVMEGIPDASDPRYAASSAAGLAGGAKAIIDTLDQVKNASQSEFDRSMSSLRSGFGQFGGKDYLNKLEDNFKKASNLSQPKEPTKATTNKPLTVIQNGHEYRLNPATGEYE